MPFIPYAFAHAFATRGGLFTLRLCSRILVTVHPHDARSLATTFGFVVVGYVNGSVRVCCLRHTTTGLTRRTPVDFGFVCVQHRAFAVYPVLLLPDAGSLV